MLQTLESQVKDLLKDWNGFEVWLSSQPELKVVGRKGSLKDCPISNYLNSHLSIESVDGSGLKNSPIAVCERLTAIEGKNIRNAPWLRCFIEAMDKQGHETLSAGYCKEILQVIKVRLGAGG